MARGLIVLIAALLLGACASAPKTDTEIAKEAICEYTKWEGCSEVQAPTLVESDLIRHFIPGVRGLTPRDPSDKHIFIVRGMDPGLRTEVITHETVHAIARDLGITTDNCESEALARKIASEILHRPYDHTWWKRYGCEEKTDAKGNSGTVRPSGK